MNHLKGKVAVVVGVALGASRAIAVRMAAEDVSLAVLDVLDVEGRGLANELTAQGLAACFWHCDVSKEGEG